MGKVFQACRNICFWHETAVTSCSSSALERLILPHPPGLISEAPLLTSIGKSIRQSRRPSIRFGPLRKRPGKMSPVLFQTHNAPNEVLLPTRYDVVLGMLERRLDGDPSEESTMRRAAREVLARTRSPNPIHNALIHLGQRFGQTLLATTNFDRLLSEAAKSERVTATSFALGEIPNPSRRTDFGGVLHIHGKLRWKSEKGSALILTDQDFGDFYLRRHQITSFLYDAARIFHLVLVGYSANDSPGPISPQCHRRRRTGFQ